MHSQDERFMALALELASRGIGTTSPNPRVGAIVARGAETVGEAWHRTAGGAHAEAAALDIAGEKSNGATLYVTLEPCSTAGKTPPCTEKIIEAGLARVVVGTRDPNPKHSGRGIDLLNAAGIETECGILERECRILNEGFEKYITRGLPFVTLKSALSLDGKIAAHTGESKWITCEESRALAHRMRNEADAILVGIGTVLKDDPELTIRHGIEKTHDPVRVVVDSHARMPVNSRLLSGGDAGTTILAVTRTADEQRVREIASTGAAVLPCGSTDEEVDLNDLMRKLAERGIVYVLAEGGGTLAAGLLESGLVDKIVFMYAPIIIGGKNAVSVVMGRGADDPGTAVRIKDIDIRRIGSNFVVEGYVMH
jgi:diaminohydroxyphosphoribosylaminopyrimidine deaminase/5-amino-6-(5-phosphoribosylamino)uracil reductase